MARISALALLSGNISVYRAERMTVLYILLAILLLGVLIAVHESGHFLAARLMHIEVEQFAIGVGPKLVSWHSRKHSTLFSIRAVPLGGFCAFYGEHDLNGEKKNDPKSLSSQNVWKRMFMIVMGPGMNFIVALLVAVLFFWGNGVDVATGIDPFVAEVMAAGPAYEAGLKDKDVILEVNGKNMLDGTVDTLVNTISGYREGDPPLKLKVRRGEETVPLTISPVYDAEAGKMRIGITIGGIYRTERIPLDLPGAVAQGWRMCMNASGAVLNALRDLVTVGKGFENMSGPVGIVSILSQEVESGGFRNLVLLLVILSVNLGLMNLLPIPGLDGSRLVFGLIEAVRGKPVPIEKESMIHFVGLMLLLVLLVMFTFNDVIKLFR